MSEFTIEVQGGATVRLPTGGKYCPRDILVTGKGGDTEAAYNEGYEIGAKEGAEVGYNRGKQEEYDRLVDPAKIIEKTVSGSVVRVNDVSEIPHKCTVSVDKDASVSVCGKNLLNISELVLGSVNYATGSDSFTVTRMRTGYIRVGKEQLYTVSGNSVPFTKAFWYDSDKNFIGHSSLTEKAPPNTKYVRMIFGNSSTAFTEEDLANVKAEHIQFELGSTATAYEPYREPSEYTISAGQTVEVDSICPTMTLFADKDATITFGYHKSWGIQTEYDRFWDAYQNNGNRKNYAYGFSYEGWNDTTFRPKHNIVPTQAQYMFNGSGIIDLIGCLEKSGVVIDFSKCTNFSYMMSNGCSIKHFPPVDIGSGASFQDGFRYAGNLESGSLVNVKPTHTWSNAFANCSSLVDITFSGTIGKTISFAQSGKLSDASIQSIIEALADLTGETAQTLTFHKDVGGRLTQAQKDTISAKNWTLAY